MSKKFIIFATLEEGFWRCGRHFTKEGVVVMPSDFNEKQWEALKDEPMLRVREATDEEATGVEERLEKIAEAIGTFTADDFQRDGKPKLDSLNALLSDDLGKISGGERDLVWEAMKEKGFAAPQAAT